MKGNITTIATNLQTIINGGEWTNISKSNVSVTKIYADRQPEFTQIDCEMAFVEQEDILNVFEGLTRHLLKKKLKVDKFPRMTYQHAIQTYGNDKPDIRFGMEFGELNAKWQNKEFAVFNTAELVVGIAVPSAETTPEKKPTL
jgi:aspartyl-tRNA synthetase